MLSNQCFIRIDSGHEYDPVHNDKCDYYEKANMKGGKE